MKNHKQNSSSKNKIEELVLEIKQQCLLNKQKALLELTKKFDKIELNSLIYQISNNIKINEELKDAINIARDNIYKFHKAEYEKLIAFENDKIETSEGITCWKKFLPIEKVGIYIPNKLFSSVLMNIIPAQIAGCEEITICTPPNPSNEILYTLNFLGIEKIYTIGGSQAIFAMGYGIGEVPKVDKIFGPGNEFVDAAKRLISNEIAIDMPAGPSEILIIADEGASKNGTIFDLLAQLEHGKESKAWCFCADDKLVEFINKNIEDVAKNSSRWGILENSIKNLSIEKVKDIEEAIEKSNKIAPEHLILNVKNPEIYLNKIKHAGSVFIGRHTPESLGDYISGTNHVLPTNGFAKSFSGLSVFSFGKFTTFQTATKNGLDCIAKSIKKMAELEELEFHWKSLKRD